MALAWKDGKIIYQKTLGEFTPKTPAPIASCSKWLTAALVMIFVDEGKISSAFDTAAAILITKKLMTPWTKWDAYKLGLINEKGKRTDKIPETKQEKESLSVLNKFVIGLRRIFLSVFCQ